MVSEWHKENRPRGARMTQKNRPRGVICLYLSQNGFLIRYIIQNVSKRIMRSEKR